MTHQIILQAMRAQAWAQVKANLETIRAVDYAPEVEPGRAVSARKNRDEWEAKCEKRRALVNDFIQAMEGDELHL